MALRGRRRRAGPLIERAVHDKAAAHSARRLTIDYADLPVAVWIQVAPHLQLEIDSAAVDGMIAESRFYSKSPEPRVFGGGAVERRPITDAVRQAARCFAEPGYRALASRA